MADPTITTLGDTHRRDLINKYVTRSALEVFLLNLLNEEDGGLLATNDPALDEIDTITLMLSTPIYRELWPLIDAQEREQVHAQKDALVRRLFAALAAAEPGFYADKAAHFANPR